MPKKLRKDSIRLLVLILFAAMISSCEKPADQPGARASAEPVPEKSVAPAPPKKVNVATLTLAPQSLQYKIEFVGKLLPNERVDVHN
jgi:hypothetical protein